MNVRHNILSRFLGVLTVMVFALLSITSCSETETTDKTDFITKPILFSTIPA